MERRRREFLRTMSTAAALPALAPLLKTAAETGSVEDPAAFPAAASLDFRAHFPLLKESVNGRPLVYLDSAAATQRPREVVDALSKFYLHDSYLM
jgi:selenocysteine lyase/cysteine desulfurase